MRSGPGAALRAGFWCGALAGLFVALGDFGATWLWLPVWRDRGSYFLRMLGAIPPTGALLGLVLVGLGVGLQALVRRTAPGRKERAVDALWALVLATLTLPACRWIALKLCSGGMMSRLAQRGLIEWALTLALPLFLFATLFAGLRLGRRLWASPARARWVAALLFVSAFGLGKLNQTFLPNLYDYLHAFLSLLTWLGAALGFLALGRDPQLQSKAQRLLRTSPTLVSCVILLAAFAADLLTLDKNLNVRVAMFDPRSSSSRALLSALDPALRGLSRRTHRSSGTLGNLFTQETPHGSLPTLPGAHVLIITIDALRADHLSTYGYERETSPEIDRLTQGAVQFQRAYAQAPHSSYSLSSLHTSEYLHEVVELGRPLPEATLATTLAANGYHTAAFFTDGIFHTEGQRLAPYRDGAFGFALFDHTNRESEAQTDRVLTEVDRIRQQGEPPSLLWVHYFDVHEPYQETTFGTSDRDRYDSEIKHVDREVGRLLKGMSERFEREVVLAITADHGEEFREHGGVYHGSTLYDEQVRVPLILRMPGLPAKKVDAPVEVVDLAPTLLGAVGVAVPESMRGKDLRAIALADEPPATAAFSAVLTKRMAVRWPYKLIADLRFGLYELYDLSADPHERRNLASSEPERLSEMRDLVYAWLDSLEHSKRASPEGAANAEDSWERALLWGRLGDRRAVEPMSKLILDTEAPVAIRVEAGQILAKLADERCAPALLAGLTTEPFEVAAEAAIALGRMYDARARDALRKLVHVEDPHVRARAAVSLGRLRDVEAVPALIDALWVAPTQYEREEAVRWLGRLRDPRALEPLLSLLPEFGLRYLVTVALGQIGDSRAYDALIEMLRWETHTNIRDELVRGLGLLGDERALPVLVGVFAQEAELKNTSESLVRLGALEKGYLAGVDVAPGVRGLRGLGECQAGPLFHDWNYLARTTCKQIAQRAELTLPWDRGEFSAGAELVLRVRRDGTPEVGPLKVSISGHELATLEVDGSWREHRVEVPAEWLGGTSAKLALDFPGDGPYVVLDHALLVPRKERANAGRPLGGTNPADHAQSAP